MKRKTRKQTSDDTVAEFWGCVPPTGNTKRNIDPRFLPLFTGRSADMNAEFMRMMAPSGHALSGRKIPVLSDSQQTALLRELLKTL